MRASAGLLTPLRRWDGAEGNRYRLGVAPGALRVGVVNPVRREKSDERARQASIRDQNLLASDYLLPVRLDGARDTLDAVFALASSDLADWSNVDAAEGWVSHLEQRTARLDAEEVPGPARITEWSRKSRARMVRTLAQLDYAPLFAGGGVPAMITLTYPGDWLPVAATSKVCTEHFKSLRRRFLRAWGVPMVAIWKREFQRRGAPHYHLLMVPPRGVSADKHGEGFRDWLSRSWAEVVGHPDAAERARHLAAGTGVDYAEGMRAKDPKRLAVYFSKHGTFGAKEYQNQAPAEWVAAGSVGRFWGYFGLDLAVTTVEVTAVEAIAAARVLRRWQRANGYRAEVRVWRMSGARYDEETGELLAGRGRWRTSHVRQGARMRGHLGFVVLNDAPAMLSKIAGHLDTIRSEAQEAELAAWAISPSRLSRLDLDAGDLDQSERCCVLCGSRLASELVAFGQHHGDCRDLD